MRTVFVLRRPILFAVAAICLIGLTVLPAEAQIADLLGQKSLDRSRPSAEPKATVALTPDTAKPGDVVTLSITIDVPPGGWTYSMDPGFSGRTNVRVTKAVGLEPVGDGFTADHPPKIVFEPLFNKNVQKFTGRVTWSRTYRMQSGVLPEQIAITGNLRYQVCNDRNCTPKRQNFTVTLTSDRLAAAKTTSVPRDPKNVHPFSDEQTPKTLGRPGPATVRVALSPRDAAPGDNVRLSITVALQPDWHTYSTTMQPGNAAVPTAIVLEKANGLVPLGDRFVPDQKPEAKTFHAANAVFHQEVHHGTITWTRSFRVRPAAGLSGYGISGSIRYQTCTNNRCQRPRTVHFQLGDLNGAGPIPVAVAVSTKTPAVVPGPSNTKAPNGPTVDRKRAAAIPPAVAHDVIALVGDEEQEGSLPLYLLYAFLGGMILNVMPCVLPVLAIKVMSFVQQAGESRSRILVLNIAYSVGVIGVFLILATLAVVAGYGWGGLFQHWQFNLIMACIVFAMGLSLLGVFEIPVPGLVGTAAGGQQREGLSGALLTGVFATLLATPCAGPFMGVTIAWSLNQPAQVTYLIFAVMGLGMAVPYVIFGLFPAAIKWLPKPGPWMVRFKEFAGFVLMGTVIFLANVLGESFTIPLLVMLLGISLGLWMIGNLYDVNAHIRHKTAIRVAALILTGGICLFGYQMVKPDTLGAHVTAGTGTPTTPRNTAGGHSADADDSGKLPWEPFSEERLVELRQQKRGVLIDFSAEWCLVCKKNETFALNTPATRKLIRQHGIVTMYADATHGSPLVKRWLRKFNSSSVPLTVIFPVGRPNEAILIRDSYSQSKLLEKLREAVRSPEKQASRAEPPDTVRN